MLHSTTVVGIIIGGPALFNASKSWFFGLCALMVLAPLFPAIQAILTGGAERSLIAFTKIYVAEYTSLVLQILFLIFTAPFILIMVAGRLLIAILIGAGIAWIIVGLQQLGWEIGRRLPGEDIAILGLVSVALAAAVGIYWLLRRFMKRHEEGYFELWARWFVRIREIFSN
jgi:hypothetical protein